MVLPFANRRLTPNRTIGVRDGKVLGPLWGSCGGGRELDLHKELGQSPNAGTPTWSRQVGSVLTWTDPFWNGKTSATWVRKHKPGTAQLEAQLGVPGGNGTWERGLRYSSAYPTGNGHQEPRSGTTTWHRPQGPPRPRACALHALCATPSGHSVIPPFRGAHPRGSGPPFCGGAPLWVSLGH